jgi:hypothetical protein
MPIQKRGRDRRPMRPASSVLSPDSVAPIYSIYSTAFSKNQTNRFSYFLLSLPLCFPTFSSRSCPIATKTRSHGKHHRNTDNTDAWVLSFVMEGAERHVKKAGPLRLIPRLSLMTPFPQDERTKGSAHHTVSSPCASPPSRVCVIVSCLHPSPRRPDRPLRSHASRKSCSGATRQ